MTLLAILVALFTTMGSKMLADINAMYETQLEQLHGAHNLVIMDSSAMKDIYIDYLNKDSRISEYEVRDCVNLEGVEIHYDEGIIDTTFIVEDFNHEGDINKVIIEDKAENVKEDGIYVPKAFKAKGFLSGDTLTLKKGRWQRTYHIAGFFTDTTLGFENAGGFHFYLEDEAYKEMYLNSGLSTEILIRCNDTKDATAIQEDFLKYIKTHAESLEEYQSVLPYGYEITKLAYGIFSMMGAGMLMGFTIIIVAIMLLVIRFRIKSNIEESLQDIGILRALGYTNKEVVMSFAYEYVLTSIVGGLTGIVLSYFILPSCGKMLVAANGLNWISRWHPGIDFAVLVGTVGIVFVISYLAACKSKKYDIRTALMKGNSSHSFHHNIFSLEKKGNLHILLALKDFVHTGKQNIMVAICIAGVSFAMVFGMLLYTTFVGNIKLVTRILGMEIADVEVEISSEADPEEVRNLISNIEGVRKTNLGQTDSVFIDGVSVMLATYEDYEILETENVYEGRFCKYDNEVAITGALAKILGKGIGDTVTIESSGYKYDYVITGIGQSGSNMGRLIKLTKEGYLKLNPPGKMGCCYVYLDKDMPSEKFIPKLEQYFGIESETAVLENGDAYEKYRKVAEDKMRIMMESYGIKEMDYSICVDGMIISGNSRSYMVQRVTNMYLTGQSTMAAIQSMFTMVVSCILIVTVVVISLMLSLLIRTMLLQRKVHFGILKALGYTNKQLMLQIALSFAPAILIGTIVGTLVCSVLAGPIATAMLSSSGITKMQFAVSPWMLILTAAAIAGFAFISAMLQAYRVRKVTVYELLTE